MFKQKSKEKGITIITLVVTTIETLNNTAEKYINSNYSTDARCVGSVPTVENGMFINKNSETQGPVTMQFEYNGSTNFRMLLVVV